MAIPSSRKVVFEELHRLVQEFDDCDGANSCWDVDDALSQLIVRLNGETRRARKLRGVAQEISVSVSA
jgi:hypothetical protein